jgi:hypothetical protein
MDIENAFTRAITSEIICTLEVEDAVHFKEALKNANYLALL